MSYTTSSNFANKSLPELLEDIYERINRLENYMLGIKQEKEDEENKDGENCYRCRSKSRTRTKTFTGIC